MKKGFEITSMALRPLAMTTMLCDHLRFVWYDAPEFLNGIGRAAFPIFAFLSVEGYFHTHDLRRYIGRLTLFALLSELPFNLMVTHSLSAPGYQNVMWTFLLGIGLIHLNEQAGKSVHSWLRPLTAFISVLLSFVLGELLLVDYYAAGLLTILTFYFFRERNLKNHLIQILLLAFFNLYLLGSPTDTFSLFGMALSFPRQLWALTALIPIWSYHGRQGYHSKTLQYFYYAFYPLHLLAIAAAAML